MKLFKPRIALVLQLKLIFRPYGNDLSALKRLRPKNCSKIRFYRPIEVKVMRILISTIKNRDNTLMIRKNGFLFKNSIFLCKNRLLDIKIHQWSEFSTILNLKINFYILAKMSFYISDNFTWPLPALCATLYSHVLSECSKISIFFKFIYCCIFCSLNVSGQKIIFLIEKLMF